MAPLSREYGGALSDVVRVPFADAMLEMYTSGVTLTTSRVSARAVIPSVLDLIADGRLRPGLATAQVCGWDDAADVLAQHDHKTVIVRPDAERARPATTLG